MRTSTWHFFALCSCLLLRRERTMRYDTICLNIRSFRHVLQWVMELHAVPASGGLRLCRSFSLSRQRWSRLKTKKAHGAVRHRPGTFATYGRGRESAVAIGLRRRFAVCTCNVSWRPTGWRTVGHCAIMVSLHLGLKTRFYEPEVLKVDQKPTARQTLLRQEATWVCATLRSFRKLILMVVIFRAGSCAEYFPKNSYHVRLHSIILSLSLHLPHKSTSSTWHTSPTSHVPQLHHLHHLTQPLLQGTEVVAQKFLHKRALWEGLGRASRGFDGGFRRAWRSLAGLETASRGLQGSLRRASRGLEKGFKGAWEGLQGGFKGLQEGFKAAWEGLQGVLQRGLRMVSKGGLDGEGFEGGLKGAWEGLENGFKFQKGFKGAFKGARERPLWHLGISQNRCWRPRCRTVVRGGRWCWSPQLR